MADLAEYTLTQQDDVWQCEAEVMTYNSYWLEHAPTLDLKLDVGHDEWVWREIRPTIGGGRLSATITGQPEKWRRNGQVQVCDAEHHAVGTVRR